MHLIIYSDGGSRGNPGPAAAAFIIKDSTNKIVVSRGVYLGEKTNNQAEYLAVINALTWLVMNRPHQRHLTPAITYYLDSELLVKQLREEYRVKSPRLIPLVSQVKKLESKIGIKLNYRHVPRSQNQEADRLVNLTLDKITSKR